MTYTSSCMHEQTGSSENMNWKKKREIMEELYENKVDMSSFDKF